MTASVLVEHFFRHEYGRLVASLSRRVGVEHLADVEDAVQQALLAALQNWTANGLPHSPSAWLTRVAHNNLIGVLRTRTRRTQILRQNSSDDVGTESMPDVDLDGRFQEDLLRMLFFVCDDSIPLDSQLVFALKTLCGFDVREIAIRLFTTEANVYKRLARARSRLQTQRIGIDELTQRQCENRIAAVHKILYLLFTEGYLSSDASMALRLELCNEAIRLAEILAEHPVGKLPETYALLALMHFHLGRMSARVDEHGGLLLLEEQDRSRWDRLGIQNGMRWLEKSADGPTFSRYHAEAGIAAEHCIAPSFEQTRWDKISECYLLLEQFADSPIHRLNRAVAVAEWKGPEHGLAVLDSEPPPSWLADSYLWCAVKADLLRRCGKTEDADEYIEIAIRSAPIPNVKQMLQRRFQVEADD